MSLLFACPRARVACFAVLIVVLTNGGCGSRDDVESNVDPVLSAEPAAHSADVEIPDGTPDELFAFIAELDSEKLPGDVAARSESLRVRMAKRVKACDAILAQNVAPEAESSAVQMKLDALRTLSIVDPDGAGSEFQTYVTSLVDGGDPYLARLAQAKRFQNTVNHYVSQRSDDSDQLVGELHELLAAQNVGPRVFMEARDAIGWLVPNNDDQLSTEQLNDRMQLVGSCYRAIGERFSEYEDDAVASEARSLLALADQFELELLRAAARDGKKESTESLIAKLENMFRAKTLHGNELAFTIQTAQGLEFDGFLDPAMHLYQIAWKNVKKSNDEGLRAHVQQTYDRAGTRLSLLGKRMVINGDTPDGSKIQWKQYAGKYVVVCFWESWVEGWQDEIKGMQATLSKFDKESIEIVTVSLDKPEDLKNYLAANPVDLPIVMGGAAKRSGTNSPIAIRYGVDMLPFTVLIGPDGKIRRIHAFGPHLAEALEAELAE